MIVSFYALQIFLLSLLSYEDYRTKHISLGPLFLFVALSTGGLILLDHPLDYPLTFGLVGFLIALKITVLLGTKKSLIGNGDLILLLPLLLSLERSELPLFLIIAGLGGVVTSLLTPAKTAPFVPALSLSYGAILLVRYI